MIELKIVEIGICQCGKKAYAEINPNHSGMHDFFHNWIHEDFTELCWE